MSDARAAVIPPVALFLGLFVAVAGCGSNIAGADGGLGGSCTAAIQGSCRNQMALFCSEYGGVPAATLTALMEQCTADADAPGAWSTAGCAHAGAVGGCRVMQEGACVAVWLYVGTAADGMTACAEQGGTWVNP